MRFLPPVLVTLLALAFAPGALAERTLQAEPPDQNDPCSELGENICGTNGVGFYARYRYGTRWFGDFRGAVPGVGATFCIDLRFWYPAKRYAFVEQDATGLVSRAKKTVPTKNLQRMAYALWRYGRSRTPNQQAAMMLYVHSLMGDGAPGEVDPTALNPTVQRLFQRISRDAKRFHGPYRIVVDLGSGLTVGRATTVRIKVLAASGAAVPNVVLSLDGSGLAGARTRVSTGKNGVAKFAAVPTSVAGARLSVAASELPSTLPRIFVPTKGKAARNGQRLATGAPQRVEGAAEAPVAQATPAVTTKASADAVQVGSPVTDAITVAGVPGTWRADATVSLFGPFRTRDALACAGTPVSTSTATLKRGTTTSAPVTVAAAGWYTFQITVPGSPDVAAVTTPCAVAEESFRATVKPAVSTVVSAARIVPGSALSDTVTVSGLAGEAATVTLALYGPYAARDAMTCAGPPIWSGSIPVTADGQYVSESTTLTVPGYYVYREGIAPSEFVEGVQNPCAAVSETTIVAGTPKVTTQISATQTTVGTPISDSVLVTGLGALAATVQVNLYGPFASTSEISCATTPFWSGSFVANGDGTYQTDAVVLDRAGYYTYHERLAGTEASDAAETGCGEATETTIARASPQVTTQVSSTILRRGTALSDRVKVTGLGKTPATVEVELFGPFATIAAIRCDVAPVWRGRVDVAGDGVFRSPAFTVKRAGFYTYRERLTGSEQVEPTETECAEATETALAAPQILTGRGDSPTLVRAEGATGPAPTRVEIPALSLSAPVDGVGVDLANNALDVPVDIRRAGWFRDGTSPGARTGTTLIAGHVDSRRQGTGAFFNLKDARAGQRVRVTSADGRVRTYRVVSVKRYLKRNLPLGVWSQAGRHRLVLVTCGGPFLGHSYRDNIVVVAVPA